VTPESHLETQRYFELLEQRIALLGSLAQALTSARASVASLDIASLEIRISEQAGLCNQIRTVDTELDRVQAQCAAYLGMTGATAPGIPGPDMSRLRDTLTRLNQVQSTVKQLNDAHCMLLRRSRRTASALLNSYHSFAELYSDPAKESSFVGERV
jgi:hypothetical protein